MIFQNLALFARVSAPYRRTDRYVKGQSRARRQILENCITGKQQNPKQIVLGFVRKTKLQRGVVTWP